MLHLIDHKEIRTTFKKLRTKTQIHNTLLAVSLMEHLMNGPKLFLKSLVPGHSCLVLHGLKEIEDHYGEGAEGGREGGRERWRGEGGGREERGRKEGRGGREGEEGREEREREGRSEGERSLCR